MKFTAYNYSLAAIVLGILLMMAIMEAFLSTPTIALWLTIPLLPLLFFLKNTYTLHDDTLTLGIFNKASRRIWYKEIQKVETEKNIFGQEVTKVYFSSRDFLKVKLGNQQTEFLKELNKKLEQVNDKKS